MKAVIETGGKQYYVEEGTEIYVEKLDVQSGKDITLDKVLMVIADMLDKIEKEPLYEDDEQESHVLYKFEREKPFTITREADAHTWTIRGKDVEKLLRMTKFTSDEAANRFAMKLRKMGIDDELRRLGAEEGDTIRILDLEFEYEE